MAKRKKQSAAPSKRAVKHKRDVFDFLFESRAAVFFIGLNAALFAAFNFLQNPLPSELILSPSALLQGRIWTILTSGFIHAGLGHLVLNCVGIFVFGRVVEKEIGPGKTAIIYTGALAFSMLFAVATYGLVMHRDVAIIGASGAVMGLVAAATFLAPLRITYELILPLPVMMKGWMFLYADLKGFLGGEKDGISHAAHLFGFLSIAVLVYFFSASERKQMRLGILINLVSFLVFLALRRWILLV